MCAMWQTQTVSDFRVWLTLVLLAAVAYPTLTAASILILVQNLFTPGFDSPVTFQVTL